MGWVRPARQGMATGRHPACGKFAAVGGLSATLVGTGVPSSLAQAKDCVNASSEIRLNFFKSERWPLSNERKDDEF
jgi:hypothetical protein